MALPVQRTVTGTYVNPVTGRPYDGTNGRGQYVVFEPYPAVWTDQAGNQILLGDGRVHLDENGHFSKALVCTDAEGVLPAGRLWMVHQFVGDSSSTEYIAVPEGSGSLDISDLFSVDIEGVIYTPVPGPAGADGAPGESAYEVAVDNGFSGTEPEWLESLIGPEGPQGPQPPLGAAGAGSSIALRSTDASTTNSRTPTGSAGGDLSGTYPNPSVARLAGIELTGTPTPGDTLVAVDSDTVTWSAAGSSVSWVFDVTDPAYGAVGDAVVVSDGAMASGSAVLTSATANWPLDIAGKRIAVKNANVLGVTTLITVVDSRQSATQITLSAPNVSGNAISGALVTYGTDDTAAIQAAVDAAEQYLATHTYAQVFFPPRAFIVAGALNNTKSGNGQIVFGVYPTSGVKRILEFRGATGGAAAVRHWQQQTLQFAGSCLLSLGVYASTSAQTANINADGNPGVISGPNEGFGYGVSAVYSNIMPVIRDLAILTSHSSFGLTYGALNLWGAANCHIENFGYGTAGIVASSSDYTSPGNFGNGLSVGLLLPAPGNNDNVIAKNISCGGGYTYAFFLTEHGLVDRYMALYCWAGLVAIGSYAGSVGSVHAMKVISASIEACTNELYIYGPGSSGVGPIIDIDQLSTENSTPNIAGTSTAAMNSALGKVRLTGLFAEAGVSTSAPTGIELLNGQVPRMIKRKTAAFTCSPIDRTLICDTSGGAFTGTLPAADFNPVQYEFKNIGANTLTVATASGQLIYTTSGTGATTKALAEGESLRVQAMYNGSSWGWYAT